MKRNIVVILFIEGDLTVSVDPKVPPYEYVVFSGLRYEIDISRPVGKRVRRLTLEDGSPLDPDGKYDVVTNNYLANLHLLTEGNAFAAGEDLPVVAESDVNDRVGSIRDMITDYMVNVKGVKGRDGIAEFTPEKIRDKDADWRVIGYHWNAKKHARVARLVRKGRINIEDYQDQFGNTIRPITEKDLAVAKQK